MEPYGTAATKSDNTEPFTIDTLVKMIDRVKDSPAREYMLISPEGILYKGTADQLTPVLLKDVSWLNDTGTYDSPI